VLLDAVLHGGRAMARLAQMHVDLPHQRIPTVTEFAAHAERADRRAVVECLEARRRVCVAARVARDLALGVADARGHGGDDPVRVLQHALLTRAVAALRRAAAPTPSAPSSLVPLAAASGK